MVLIRELNREGLSIFLVEQNVMQSLEIADRAYVIDNGRVVLSGAAGDLIDDPALQHPTWDCEQPWAEHLRK